MRTVLTSLQNTITLKQNKAQPHSYDVFLKNLNQLRPYSTVELTMFVYPYSRNIDASDFTMLPYEEYVKDVTAGRRSTYRTLGRYAGNFFGLFLGVLIAAIFLIVKPDEIVSIESVVAILGAYAIGKEFWSDIDRALGNLTRNWTLSWRDEPFHYVRQDLGTIQRFSQFARIRRYGDDTTLPSKLDFISHSNSKTVEMQFKRSDLANVNDNNTRIMTVNFSKESLDQIQEKRFMFGVKLSLTKLWPLFKANTELFQALDKDKVGTINIAGNWQENAILVRRTANLGRWKYYHSVEVMPEVELLTAK